MKKIDVKTKKLFDLEETIAKSLFEKYTYPWEVFKELGSFIEEIGATLPDTEYLKIGKNIWVHRSVKIMPTIALAGPLIIGKDASIRSCAFFRGNVIIGEGAVAGNSCEFKNAILFKKAQVPHFSYVGDSILGEYSHLGAGALTSNVKSDKTLLKIHFEDGEIETGLKKFGAILSDHVEVGCQSVLNPGTIIFSHTNIYPLSAVRGIIPGDSIYKDKSTIVKKRGKE